MRHQDAVITAWNEFDDDDLLGAEDVIGDTLVVQLGSAHGPITFPSTPLRISVYLALGADLTAAPSTWVWTMIPPDLVRYADGLTCNTGRIDESSTVSPGNGGITLDNRDGRFSRRNPTGPYYGLLTRNTPILVNVDAGNGDYAFMQQFVNEWPLRMERSLTDFTVPIRTGGIMRRLDIGTSLDQSAMRRAIMGDANLLQYWPCEDGTGALTLASALGVGSPLALIGSVAPGSSTAVGAGTDALPVLSTGLTYMKGGVPTSPTPSTWTYCATFYFTSVPVFTAGDGTSYLLYVPANQSGSLVRWNLYWNDADDTVYLTVWTSSATVVTVAGPVLTNAQMINCWLTFWVSASQNGSNVDYAFGVERTTTSTSSSQTQSGTINTQTVGQVDGMLVFNGKSAASTTVGHVFVLSRALTASQTTPAYGAITAYVGETATARITRLCAEQGVPLVLTSAQGSSALMGAQPRGAFLNALRDCEKADQGVLYETGWGLGYQPINARYNLTPALVLDISQKHLSDVPEPTDDDQRLRNSWTVTRPEGSPQTYTDAASQAAEGEYPDTLAPNVQTDDQARQMAAWLTHVGTNPDARWPALPLAFHRGSAVGLIQPWEDMAFGQRVTIVNPPSQIAVAGDLVDVIVEGKSERVDQFTWSAKLNTSPARPYIVLMLNDPTLGRISNASTLLAAINTTDTSLSVATTDTAKTSSLWTTSAAELPFDIEINGERMTVASISGSSSPQTFTVTRSVNGVVKSHLAHTATAPVVVTLWRPPVLSL